MSNSLSIVGIRSKSTSNSPVYFFSVESKNLDDLKLAKNIVAQSLYVHNIECEFVRRYHD